MDHDLICSWLGLPPGSWPPDHYRLLGVQPGEANAELIELHVHERLDTVRCYQITHAEQATEAMNRLAQAFVCLTESSSKKAYDALLGIVARSTEAQNNDAPPQLPPQQRNSLDWLPSPAVEAFPVAPAPAPALVVGPATATMPPLRPPESLPSAPLASVESGEMAAPSAALPAAIPVPTPLPTGLPLEPVDPMLEVAQSGPALRGIATKRGLFQRVARTRRLLRLWNNLGIYISSPKRRLRRTADGAELIGLLNETTKVLKGFPPLLGEAGQPGYLVLALTQVDTIKVFQSFSPHQREALSRDWGASLKLLTTHRDFLRQELRAMRKRPLRQRFIHAAWSLIVDQPGAVLLLLALLAVNVALWRSYAEELLAKLFKN